MVIQFVLFSTVPDKNMNRSQSVASGILTGISFTDEEAIIGHLDLFSQRLHNITEIIETVKDFSQLVGSAIGLPVIDAEYIVDDVEDPGEYVDKNERDLVVISEEDQEGKLKLSFCVYRYLINID